MNGSSPQRSLKDLLRDNAADPFAFDAFLKAWNDCFESPSVLDASFEEDAKEALEAASENMSTDLAGPKIRQMLSAFPNPAIIVHANGRVIEQNIAAMETLSIDQGDLIDALPFALQGGGLLSEAIGNSFRKRNVASEVSFFRAYSTDDNRTFNAAVLTRHAVRNADQTALLIIIDPHFEPQISNILMEALDLTDAECEILVAFMSGAGLTQIARNRNRSLATVRTQMQTIMTKAGVSSQADLMRNALALAQFQTDISKVAEVARHPFRKSSGILRPGGRSVEATLAGDMQGKLIVVIPDITLSTFPAVVEQQFAAAGLCVTTLARPGYGGTDPAPKEADYTEVMAGDLKALLSQLGHETCVLVGHSTSSAYAYRLGELAADHISRVLLLCPFPPAPYLHAAESKSPWATALLHVSSRTPGLFSLMVGAGLKAWKLMGTRSFVALQLREHSADVAASRRPDVLREFEAAFEACVAQGTSLATADLYCATGNWTDWLSSCKVPVEWLQGAKEPIGVIDNFDALAATTSAPHKLTRVDDGGFLTFLTHTHILIERLCDDNLDIAD